MHNIIGQSVKIKNLSNVKSEKTATKRTKKQLKVTKKTHAIDENGMAMARKTINGLPRYVRTPLFSSGKKPNNIVSHHVLTSFFSQVD